MNKTRTRRGPSEIEDRLRYGRILCVEALDPAVRRVGGAAELERCGFEGSTTVADLQTSRCRDVPRTAGVYLVLDRNRFEILYIGKAGGPGNKSTLRKRLTAYLRGGRTGKYAGHQRGKDIWTLPERGETACVLEDAARCSEGGKGAASEIQSRARKRVLGL
jgi:hypothetical protein